MLLSEALPASHMPRQPLMAAQKRTSRTASQCQNRPLAYDSIKSSARRSIADECLIWKSKVTSIDLGEIGL